ncbi:hypothetical protein ACFWV1_28960 [Streptomyces sp. NPDC058700]|uniref:hypothetical protein n=1 Tax=Streptomyces sp. NPDC058700 TaxID=3346607 RepID=UPI0036652FD0
MTIRFIGGPLAGIERETADTAWAGGWFTVGGADWTLYVATHRDPAADIVLAEVRTTAPRHR